MASSLKESQSEAKLDGTSSRAERKTSIAELPKAEQLAFLKQQGIKIGDKNPGASYIRRAYGAEDGLVTFHTKGIDTLWDNFKRSVELFAGSKFLGCRVKNAKGERPYVWITYKEGFERVTRFASGLRKLGAQPREKIGLYSKNRLEWTLAEQACNSQSMPTVAIYDTFGPEVIAYIINHSEIKIVVTGSFKETTEKLLKVAKSCPNLTHIIQMDDLTDEHREALAKSDAKVELISWSTVEKLGQDFPFPPSPPISTDLAVVMYTSGTTGPPKGVMHTHRSFVAAVGGVVPAFGGIFPTDSYLSYLPLAHIMERVSITAMIAGGASIGFYSGDARIIIEDLAELRPTLLCGVPRIFERIHTAVTSKLDQSSFKKSLFNKAYGKKSKNMQDPSLTFEEANRSTPVWNRLVFEQIKGKLGGHVRLILSGAAPLSPLIQEFMKVCFGCPVIQGYGLTETSAAGCLSNFNDSDFGHVGGPIGCVEIKLVDIPDMNYYTGEDGSEVPPNSKVGGEIWIRGPAVAVGYYKDEQKTKEDFDGDGWFHTGDIGRWNPNGTLNIVDRKKNIFKLSQGEYVAAEKLELIYGTSRFVGQIFVYGDSFTPFLVAIVKPEHGFIQQWAQNNKLESADVSTLCAMPELGQIILEDFNNILKEQKLQGFEAIKGIFLTPDEWTPQNDLTTPTMKLKRSRLKEHFEQQILDLYEKLDVKDLPGHIERRKKAEEKDKKK